MTAEQNPTVVINISGDSDSFVQASKRADTSMKSNEDSITRLIKKLEAEKALIAKFPGELRQYTHGLQGATKAQVAQVVGLRQAIAEQKRLAQSNSVVTGQMRLMRGGFGQIGHQIQDVAVQLQMGTNAMLVFGQQGSQIASLFGPYGAMIGAITAVGAALFTYVQATGDSAEKTKTLSEEVRELAQSYQELNGQRAAAAMLDILEREKQLNEVLGQQNKKRETAARYAKEGKVETKTIDVGGMPVLIDIEYTDEESMKKFADDLIRVEAELEETGETMDLLKRIQDGYSLSVDDTIDSLEEEVALLGKSARERAVWKAAMEGANAEQIIAINLLYEKKDAHDAAEDSLKQSIKTEADFIKEVEAEARAYKKAQDELQRLIDRRDQAKDRMKSVTETSRSSDPQIARLQSDLDRRTKSINDFYDLEVDLAKRTGGRLVDINAERDTVLLAQQDWYVSEVQKRRGELRGVMDDAFDMSPTLPGMDAITSQYDRKLEAIATYFEIERELLIANGESLEQLDKEQAEARLAIDQWYLSEKERLHAENNARIQQFIDAQKMAAVDNIAGIAQEISSALGQASTLGKAAFAVSQAIAAAQAIMNAHLEASSIRTAYAVMASTAGYGAPAVLAAGQAHAATALASGYITAGMIAGQTIASFEGGGFTPSGARSGGMDGRGGMLAVLHPNEQVVDLTRSRKSESIEFDGRRDVGRINESAATSNTNGDSGEAPITIVNLIDNEMGREMVKEYMSTSEGDRLIVNKIQRNTKALR